jgi:hypothetical protein
MKARVAALVANGQLAFVNGGWCMHDEASTHYIGMIDQVSSHFLLSLLITLFDNQIQSTQLNLTQPLTHSLTSNLPSSPHFLDYSRA